MSKRGAKACPYPPRAPCLKIKKTPESRQRHPSLKAARGSGIFFFLLE